MTSDLKMDKFTSGGGYGCVHYPRLKCDGLQQTIFNQDGYISKLVKISFSSVNEYNIGKKFKKSHELMKINENQPIVYVEKKCIVNKKNVNRSGDIDNSCKKIINKYKSKQNNASQYCLLFSKYHESVTVSDQIRSMKVLSKTFISYLFDFYNFCIYVINIIYNKFNIIHMDLHMRNVLYDKNKKFHLIDFGVSVDLSMVKKKSKINYDYLKNCILRIPDIDKTPNVVYSLGYPVEVYILKYMLNNDNVGAIELMNIITRYYDIFKNTFDNIFSQSEIEEIKDSAYVCYYDKFINNGTIESCIVDIINNATYSWDIYFVTMKLIPILFFIKNDENMERFLQMMHTSIHYDYMQRLSCDDIYFILNSINSDI